MPLHLMDKDMCLAAIKQPKFGMSLSKIPEDYRDHDVCLIAVKKDGEDLRYVPESLLT